MTSNTCRERKGGCSRSAKMTGKSMWRECVCRVVKWREVVFTSIVRRRTGREGAC